MSVGAVASQCSILRGSGIKLFKQIQKFSNGSSEHNLIAAVYVNQEGECHKNGFDATSRLPSELQSTVRSFLTEKQIKIKPGTSRTFYWPNDSIPYKSFRYANKSC